MARTDADAKRTAQGLADRLNRLINRTVSTSRLSVVLVPGSPGHFDLFRRVQGQVAPLGLNGSSLMLMFQQKVEPVDGHCTTLTYSYRLQRTTDHRSWLCRWEYLREPPTDDYPYPLAHFHINSPEIAGHTISEKHFPTDRVAIELILLHLIEEWGVSALSDDYRAILDQSLEDFAERRTDR